MQNVLNNENNLRKEHIQQQLSRISKHKKSK